MIIIPTSTVFAIDKLDKMMVAFVVNCVGFLLNLSFVLCYFYFGDGKARKSVFNQCVGMLFITGVAIGFWVVENNNQPVG